MRGEVLDPYIRAADHQHQTEHQSGELESDLVAQASEHSRLAHHVIALTGHGADKVFAQLSS